MHSLSAPAPKSTSTPPAPPAAASTATTTAVPGSNGRSTEGVNNTNTDASNGAAAAAESVPEASREEGIKEHKASRKRKDATVSSSSTIESKPSRQLTPMSKDQLKRFMKQTKVKKKGQVVNPSVAPCSRSNGYLLCDDKKGGCGIVLCWNNRASHLTTQSHKNTVAEYTKRQNEAKAVRKLAQARIEKDALVGSTYTDDALDRDVEYARMFFAGNIAFENIGRMKVRT